MRTLTVLLLAFLLRLTAGAAEPWLKAGDVVALVGGEDMVALAEEGWLETLVTWAQPKDHIRFRSLAWEGDTVFEQRRDLNYPTLEAQLDKIGATVVICQFGKMESFAGKEGVAAFTEAYEKLLARLNTRSGADDSSAKVSAGDAPARSGGSPEQTKADESSAPVPLRLPAPAKKRRIALVLPPRFGPLEKIILSEFLGHDGETWLEFLKRTGRPSKERALSLPNLTPRNADLGLYAQAIRTLATKYGARLLNSEPRDDGFDSFPTRDGIHLAPHEVYWTSEWLASGLDGQPAPGAPGHEVMMGATAASLRTAIAAKNRAWFHYTRPQNWAFLAGNRTNQPSSRDHLDPTKRWFPEEMEQWLPLIEAKEKEIWAMAAAR